MILFSADAILASSNSKFGKSFPEVDREDLRSSTDSTISTSLIHSVRGVKSARVPDSSFGGVPLVNCLGDVHMEQEVQDRVQVEVERGEQGIGETHGKEQGEEQRVKERTLNRTTWMTMRMG